MTTDGCTHAWHMGFACSASSSRAVNLWLFQPLFFLKKPFSCVFAISKELLRRAPRMNLWLSGNGSTEGGFAAEGNLEVLWRQRRARGVTMTGCTYRLEGLVQWMQSCIQENVLARATKTITKQGSNSKHYLLTVHNASISDAKEGSESWSQPSFPLHRPPPSPAQPP